MQTTVVGPGNVSFRYKMSSVSGDSLAFYIDTNLAASWSQGSTWPWTGNFAVPSGTHTLKWKYYKYSGSTAGSCWIDAIQWSGGVPGSGGGADWEQITYTYDPSGRRIAKDVDGVVTRYLYDGDHCIAEYDANDVQLRKYIHGPCIDEPICMIEAAGGYAGTYYYHYDALGSVVALSDADGDTVQVYEYDVYGQVAASDPNHPNRFMFTGREFDKETGLYYYRARYYNPTIGRFLQTDPIGYGADINWYAYCGNNSVARNDPSGLWAAYDIIWRPDCAQHIMVLCWDDVEKKHLGTDFYFVDYNELAAYIERGGDFCDVTPDDNRELVYFVGGAPSESQLYKITNGMGGAYLSLPADEEGASAAWAVAAVGVLLVLDGVPGDEIIYGNLVAGSLIGMALTAPESFPEPIAYGTHAGDLPATGKPNSTAVKDYGNGEGQIREYGPDGKATKDIDFGHSHHHPDVGSPHVHDWDWSKTPPRNPEARPLRPGE